MRRVVTNSVLFAIVAVAAIAMSPGLPNKLITIGLVSLPFAGLLIGYAVYGRRAKP